MAQPHPDAQHEAPHVRQLLVQERLWRRESEHRLANLLQIVSSNLASVSRRTSTAQASSAVAVAAEQISLLGRLQQTLDLAGQGSEPVPCDAPLRQLCAVLDAVVAAPRGTTVRFEAEADATSQRLRPENARNLLLIVSELVINAVKHGSPHDGTGRVDVVLARVGGRITCTVVDPGCGPDSGGARSTFQGLPLAQHLAEVAGGHCCWVFSTTGSRAQVSLPLAPGSWQV